MKLRNLTLATTVILLPSPAYAQYFECETCPAGTWNNGNYESCQKCATGTYSTGGASSCTNCLTTGVASCSATTGKATSCKGGFGFLSSGACSQCSAGTRSPGGTSGCYSCSSGSYSNAGASSCTECPAGTYSGTKAKSCTKCSAGTFSFAGSSFCYSCSSGYYSNAGASSCTKCPAGTYSTAGSSSCTKCPAGTYSTAGSSSCTKCPAGTYYNGTSCVACPAGTFSATGAVSCSACPDYHWSNAGSSGCGEIRVSMYRSFWDEDDFKNCPIGSYKTVYASTPQKCNWYVFERRGLEEWGNGAFLSSNERKLAEMTGYTSFNFDKDGRCRSCTDYGNTYASCPSWGGCPTYDYYMSKIHKKSDCGPGCSHIWKNDTLIDLRACRKLPCEVSGTFEGRRIKLNTDGYVYHAHEGQSFSNSGVSVEWSGNHTLPSYGFSYEK